MKMKIAIMSSVFLFLLAVGNAGAAQVLLPGQLIPKFVDPLPVAGDISVVDATSAGPFYSETYVPPPTISPVVSGGSPYNIHLREFKAQILPSTGVPADRTSGFAGLGANTASWVWGYLTDDDIPQSGGIPVRKSYLGPVVVAERGVPAYPTYTNELPRYPRGYVQNNLLPIDQTVDWANPLGDTGPSGCDPRSTGAWTNPICGELPYMGPLPDSVHFHGGEVPPASDGGPDSWFTQGNEITGIGYSGNTLLYPNGQEEGTPWFHPHGFGITRLNVFAGMAGVYIIMDSHTAAARGVESRMMPGPSAPVAAMPAFPQYDIPLIVQDRSFDTTGQIFYNLASNPQPNPTVHPFWIPEFIGDVICVNGKTWPYLNVEPRQYRFRLLNGSNARFYNLLLSNNAKFFVIATDDGYLEKAVATSRVLIAPGERYEVIVDFTGMERSEILLYNSARTPYPGGDPVDRDTTGIVMKFIVNQRLNTAIADSEIGDGTQIRNIRNPLVPIQNAHDAFSGKNTGSITRQLTINEVIGDGGPLELVVNNSKYNLKSYNPADSTRSVPVLPGCQSPLCRETEIPAVGDTEIWEIINITADAHPMHTHLTSFRLLDRTPFSSERWINYYDGLLVANGVLPGGGPPNQYNVQNADGAIGGNPQINAALDMANRRGPLPYEMGWKDTVVTYPGEVTRIAVRWAPQDTPVGGVDVGENQYPFDPTELIGGVGYVYHCHILDHEDNEMMRTYTVGSERQLVVAAIPSPDINGDGCVDKTDYNLLYAAVRARSTDVATYDINGDGVVSTGDLRTLVLAYTNPGGASCPPPPS